jgi:PhoH-like ATPase
MSRKIYILDTSTLIFDPSAWKHFANSDCILPIVILQELDKLKKQAGEVGKNARVCIKLLDEISDLGDINTGILLDHDILLRIDTIYPDLTNGNYGEPSYADTHILACAHRTYLENLDKEVYLVSNDINLRVKAKARGLNAISHNGDKPSFNEMYSGIQVVKDEKLGIKLQEENFIDPNLLGLKLYSQECVLFQNEVGDTISMGRKVSSDRIKIVKKYFPWGLSARSPEQHFAIDLIMDKNIDLITLLGCSGTGKSLIAIAAALELVIAKKEYERVIIYRPIQVVGNSLGYLKGTLPEKLEPHFSAIMDNFEFLLSNKAGNEWRRDLEMFQRKGRVALDAIAYIRGRSIPNSIILLDEAQNLSGEEIKTILTRAGEHTKVIITGDIEQIDRNDLDAANNGLTNIIERFKEYDLAGHMTLTRGERSRLATLASHIL